MDVKSRSSTIMTATKTITPSTARLVTFDTTLPVAQVLARLDAALNRAVTGGQISHLLDVATKEDVREGVEKLLAGHDFLFFSSVCHSEWLDKFWGSDAPSPMTYLYTIGNPIIGQAILRHDISAALHIPLRLLVREKADGTGTTVEYQLPSSIILRHGCGDEMKVVVGRLDDNLERFVGGIVSISN